MSHRKDLQSLITPRSAMAIALGILVVALSIKLGLISDTLDWMRHVNQKETLSIVTESETRGSLQEPRTPRMPRVPHAPRAARAPRALQAPLAPQSPDVPNHSEETFVVVETPPTLIGGLAALQQDIHYPEIAKKAGISGRVFLQFIVEKDGAPSEIVVTRGIGAGCDEEAVRALEQVRFNPGLQRGLPVRVKMSLPVTFRLE